MLNGLNGCETEEYREMKTTALQFGFLIGVLTGLGQALAGGTVGSALLAGAAVGGIALIALLTGDWLVDRIMRVLDSRGANTREPVSPTEPRDMDESPSERAIAA